jgi:hypothetical protein
MSEADDAFSQATDSLISLYRGLERRTLDLPPITFMPFLVFLWAGLKFYFLFLVGIFLIIPTNLVILIRNLFPGHWRYRPFFLIYVYYILLWLWRGEAPTTPVILIRPVLSIFVKKHFTNRLQRLRQEITLRDGLTDTTRSTLVGRLDSAIERWKPPLFGTFRVTILWTAIISLPAWSKQLTDFLGWLGIQTDTVEKFFAENISTGGLIFFGLTAFGYLLAVPVTALIAKRGLFVGADRLWYPGWQEGSGAYLEERKILGNLGIHQHEAPLDLWILAISLLIFGTVEAVTWSQIEVWMYSWLPQPTNYVSQAEFVKKEVIVLTIVMAGLIILAGVRRRKTGRD